MPYPDAGTDKRLVPGLGWLQRLLIIRGKAPENVSEHKAFGWDVKCQKWPPFVLAEKKQSTFWRQARIGWSGARTSSNYLLGAAWKKEVAKLLPSRLDAAAQNVVMRKTERPSLRLWKIRSVG
jgi:hypothetical protein